MLSWLEMFRAPAIKEMGESFTYHGAPHSVPCTGLGAEKTMVTRTTSWGL